MSSDRIIKNMMDEIRSYSIRELQLLEENKKIASALRDMVGTLEFIGNSRALNGDDTASAKHARTCLAKHANLIGKLK